jgi:sialate O-acetylesterase
MNRAILSILVIILSCGPLSRADIRLADCFGSGMVLQRDIPARISGYADQGESVTVTIGDQVVGQTTGAGPGRPWSVILPVFRAGPVADITVMGKNDVTLTNLLSGDVWVCSGQSNMDMSLVKGPWCPYGGVANAAEEVAAADYPRIRLFTSSGKKGWTACTPESAKSFSAAGYFFGRELQRELDVPIGLVQTAIGGTPAEYWTPRAAREAWPGFAAELESAREVLRELKPIFDADTTGQGYAARVKPLTVMRVKGVLWYQGEANAARAEQYAELMTQLIGGWRADWGQPDLPFVIMQLVNFGDGSGAWPAMRAAQQRVAETVPHASLAVGIDIGDSKNIHPKNKQDVGKRLALAALKDVYKKDVVSSGPVVQSAEFNNGKVTLMFDSCGEGQQLVFNPGEGSGFELAGVDGVFLPASVEQNEDTLILLAAGMNAPQVMRYAWSDNPVATLFNTAGLPAAPFQEFKKGNAR